MLRLITSGVRALSSAANWVAIGANAIGTLIVLALVMVINYDVVARGFFNAPFRGAVEVVQFSMVLIVFLQLPDVVRTNRLTRSDGFLILLEASRPKLAATIRRVINTASAIFMALVAYAIWPEFLEMYETKDFFGVPGIFTAPWWPIKLAIYLSAVLCTLMFLLKVLVPDTKTGAAQPSEPSEDNA
ncbi:TRAP transporter small permease [Roseibium denhamense]|uniref:TRAP transporter small permease protein n=1 Tax=Roseibium denhamense TaxID=76305 RepID=A0ABY1NGH4_9HYPH|nr:TRAP transporter small permease [Roseibium denhamense]MTI06441.1 TRAP transporter small permease [Roseibium denhamense]SMP09158.1 TRAP-type C4-dicarboxylate transport system, small permease component [Roseibium denhamense]